MKKTGVITLFILLNLAMLAAAAWKIYQAHVTLLDGRSYRVRITGHDPADIFRGRYLRFAMPDTARARSEQLPPDARRGYVTLSEGPDGFAQFDLLSSKPDRNIESLAVKLQHWNYSSARFSPPFSRYYINERQAEKAEKLFLEAVRRKEAVLLFRVKDGFAVIEDIELGGRPLRKLLDEDADSP